MRLMRRPLPLLFGILGLVVAACGGTAAGKGTVRYVDPSSQTLIDLPGGWHLYDLSELSDAPGLDDLPFVESVQGLEFPLQSLVAFDGAPFEGCRRTVDR